MAQPRVMLMCYYAVVIRTRSPWTLSQHLGLPTESASIIPPASRQPPGGGGGSGSSAEALGGSALQQSQQRKTRLSPPF
ncbi:hypothetical protein NQZ68_032525 [Dissostichus eleginoides]|nr:hypothetical protein NQZ68_032525 [Dissostichus eleginoides]